MADLKTEILSAKRRIEAVAVPELGGLTVYVRAMTGADDDVYQAALEASLGTPQKSTVGLLALLMSLTICNKAGERVFATAEEVGAMDSKAMTRLGSVALRLSGRTQEFRDELEKKVPQEPKAVGSP